MTLLDKIMNVCNQQMACAEVFCPYLACSFGAHIFNLHNQEENICTSGLVPHNVKLNVIIVSPPGLSKNESISRFIGKGKYSILTVLDGQMDRLPDGTVPEFCKVTGEITSAGFVGTIKANRGRSDDDDGGIDDDDNEEYGDAFMFRRGIIAYTEIASLFNKSEHSQDLMNHVLRVMGDNQIIKRLAHIHIRHDDVYVTVWGGIQPARIINIDNAGMDRRALYIFHDWTDDEIRKIKDFRVKEKTEEEVEALKDSIELLRNSILEFVNRVKLVNKVKWYFDRKEYATMPADINLIEGLCIGYALMTEDENTLSDTLEIRLTPKLDEMLTNMQKMKDKLKLYEQLVITIDKLQSKISTYDIWQKHMRRMGYTFSQTKELLLKAHNLGFITKEKRKGGFVWQVVTA